MLLQLHADETNRGRIMSLFGLINRGLGPMGSFPFGLIATVIGADLPLAGQLAPGDWVSFAPCTRREAADAMVRLERRLAGLPA